MIAFTNSRPSFGSSIVAEVCVAIIALPYIYFIAQLVRCWNDKNETSNEASKILSIIYAWRNCYHNPEEDFNFLLGMELRVGKKYRLGKKIGSGSFGDM